MFVPPNIGRLGREVSPYYLFPFAFFNFTLRFGEGVVSITSLFVDLKKRRRQGAL